MIKRNWQVMLPILIPLFYFVLVTFIMPRPYFIQPADLEQDYYYGSMLVNDGFPPFGIHHPGTPIYELGALIMKISGNEIENAQTFFNISYFIIALANTVALFIFSKTPEVKKAKGFGVMALLLVVSLPGWLSYSHTFGADSFLIPVTLIMLSIFWISLDLPFKQRLVAWIGVGFLAGFGLAIKLTVLPVWIAVLIGSILFALLTQKKEKTKHKGIWIQYLLIPIISAVSFILFILPTFARLPQIFINFFQRDEIKIDISLTVIKNILALLSTAPYLIPVFILMVIIGSAVIGLTIYSIVKAIKTKQTLDPKTLAKGLLLVILFVCLGYSILGITILETDQITELFDPGVTLRNSIPASLLLPFGIIFIAGFINRKQKFVWQKEWVAAALGLLIFSAAWSGYLNHREKFINYEEQIITSTTNAIRSITTTNTRVAVWDGSPGNLYGEASFHFWGNYTYAREFYDTELLSYFPNLTFLKLRDVHDLSSYSNEAASAPGWLTLWKRLFPSPYYIPPNSEMIMGENREEPISAIAVPESEIYREGTTLDELSQLVTQRFGSYQVVERNIDNENWIIFELSVGE